MTSQKDFVPEECIFLHENMKRKIWLLSGSTKPSPFFLSPTKYANQYYRAAKKKKTLEKKIEYIFTETKKLRKIRFTVGTWKQTRILLKMMLLTDDFVICLTLNVCLSPIIYSRNNKIGSWKLLVQKRTNVV